MPKNVQVGSQIIEFPDGMSDDDISAVLRKQNPPTGAPQNFVPTNTAGPSQENSLTNLFHDAGQDLTQGGTRTGLGRALGYLQGRGDQGYSGLNSSVSGGANIMGSPFTGPVEALEGAASVPQHPIAGPLKALGGLLKTYTIPSMMIGGPEMGNAIDAAIPSAKYAGKQLQSLAESSGNTPIPLNNSLPALQRLAELSERGGSGSVPAGVMQLLQRSQSPIDMAYPEARDFASNISGLSALEKMALKPQVGAQMNALRSGIHGDIANALGPEQGQKYLDAITEYARAQAS